MSSIALVGYAGVAVAAVSWLVVSFTTPSAKRAIAEWIGACGLYLALVGLFLNLVLRARAEGSTVALVAFGLLLAMFGSGFVVSVVQAGMAMRARGGGHSASATH